MGRHSMQTAAGDEGGRLAPVQALRGVIARRRAVSGGGDAGSEAPETGDRPSPVASLHRMIERRRRPVLGGAAAVVAALALGGVVTLVQGFAPQDAPGCAAAGCSADQANGTDAARPDASATTPASSPSRTATRRHTTHHTFEPTTVREASKRPRVTPHPHHTRKPRPHGGDHHRPPHHWRWHWPW